MIYHVDGPKFDKSLVLIVNLFVHALLNYLGAVFSVNCVCKMVAKYLVLICVFLFLHVFCVENENPEVDPWADVEDQDDEEIPFDPVAEMKKLFEQEVLEGQEYKDELREWGVNVEEWEQKFAEAGAGHGHSHNHGEL